MKYEDRLLAMRQANIHILEYVSGLALLFTAVWVLEANQTKITCCFGEV